MKLVTSLFREPAFWEGCKTGRAFKAFFDATYQPLYFFAHELLDNPHRAKEIVADSYLEVWRMEKPAESQEQLRSVLYVLTRNACYTYLRRAGRLAAAKAENLYSLENWEGDFLAQVIESELVHRVALDKSARRI